MRVISSGSRDHVAGASVLRPRGTLPAGTREPDSNARQPPQRLDRYARPIQHAIEHPGGSADVMDDQQTSGREERLHRLDRLLCRQIVKEIDAHHAIEQAECDGKIEQIRLHERNVPMAGAWT